MKSIYSFNSRTPGGVRHHSLSLGNLRRNVSIHAPREGCDVALCRGEAVAHLVSIHAPREGCDYSPLNIATSPFNVSIHAPREGCDFLTIAVAGFFLGFQFTHPGRGATCP